MIILFKNHDIFSTKFNDLLKLSKNKESIGCSYEGCGIGNTDYGSSFS